MALTLIKLSGCEDCRLDRTVGGLYVALTHYQAVKL